MQHEVFKKDSGDFITNMKESVDVTFSNDDDKQLKAHNKSVRYQLQNRPSGQQHLDNHSLWKKNILNLGSTWPEQCFVLWDPHHVLKGGGTKLPYCVSTLVGIHYI